jgi:hypothetical protein
MLTESLAGEFRPLSGILRGRLAVGAACFEADPSEGGRWQLLGAALETRSLLLAHRGACERRAGDPARSAHAEILSLLDALIRVANGENAAAPERRNAALSLATAVEAAVRRHDELIAPVGP